MATYEYTFTVFTPTYNRAHALSRVWDSLRRQTFRDFEWVIVDDGSTDNTGELVASWTGQSSFPVHYLRQQHAHKKTAANHAAEVARGELFLPLDSDDECVPTALERLWWHWNQIPADQRLRFSGVTSLCALPDGTVVGDRFPCTDWIDSNSIEIFHKWKVDGEKWGFQRTEVMRQFRFPEQIPGYVPEGVVWDEIARHYKTRYVNEALRIYHQSDDGVTRSAKAVSGGSPGGAYWMSSILGGQWEYFRYNKSWFIRCAINFTRFHLHTGESPIRKARALQRQATMLVIAAYPLGWFAYIADRLGLIRAVKSLARTRSRLEKARREVQADAR